MPQVETEMEVQAFATRVHGFISTIIPITAKFTIYLSELSRIDHPQLIIECIGVGFKCVHGETSIVGSLARKSVSLVDPRQRIRKHCAWRDRAMFDRQCRNLRSPIRVPKTVGVGCRVDVMRTRMVEVRPEIMLEEIRP